MLKLMRDSFKHLKWILIAVVVAFVFGFVFLDMGLSGALGGNQDRGNFAARVNGETITFNDYYRMLSKVEQAYGQMYAGGQQLTPEMAAALRIPEQTIETLIDQRLVTQEAKRMNLEATPEEVRKKLLSDPTFLDNGKFVGMEYYNNYVTGRLGYPNAAAYEASLARDIALAKMEHALMSSVLISPKAADAEYRRVNENAKIKFVLLPAAMQAARVTVTPAEVDAYYRNNQAKYTHGEQRLVRYLLADFAKLRASVVPTDADLRKKYEEMKSQFQMPESARVLHILVRVDPNAPPAVDAAAKAKAEGLVAQLRAGADFGTLARANSEDPSSAGNGGDMDWVKRGDTVEPFDQAIFSIPLNQISDPIRTPEYGYHIVKVLDRRPAGVRPFEEVRGQLQGIATTQMVQEQAQNEVARISAIMRNKKPANGSEFAAYANDKVTSNETGWIQKTDQIPGVGNHPPMQEWIFGAKKGDVSSEAIGTPRGPVIVRLEDIRPAGVSALEEIRAKVEEDARNAKAAEAARGALAQMMTGATTIDQVAQKAGVTAQETPVTRQGTIPGISGDITAIVEAALAANQGDLKGPLTVKEGAVAFQVLEQKKVTDKELAENRNAFVDSLRQQQARNLRMSLIKRLRQASKIEVNEDLIKPPAQQQAGL